MRKYSPYIVVLLTSFLAISSCKKNKPSQNESNCPGFDLVPTSPYEDPVWHPSGNIIGFNHTPIKEIKYSYGYDCPRQAQYIYETDSTGFWLINSDGSSQRRILPYQLQNPAWSRDGKWIAFVQGAQIFKMPFDGEKFDESGKVQLTFSGRNFFPAWSPDGEKIVYNESICNSVKTCGVWLYNLNNNSEVLINKYGNYPSWMHSEEKFVFLTGAITNQGDSLWLYSIADNKKKLIKFLSIPDYHITRGAQVSPDDTKIVFTSQSRITGKGIQLYIINSDGSNIKQLTTDGTTGFSWSPDGKIIYVSFDETRIDKSRGVLWTMNADGSNKKQLTYNSLK